jgi:hypothetical protein
VLTALTALAGVAAGAFLALFARDAAAPAFRQALSLPPQHLALHVRHDRREPEAATGQVDYLPEHLHPAPAATAGESAEVPSF